MSENRRENRGPGRPTLAEVLANVDDEVALLHGSLGGLPRAVEADHILRAIWLDDVHNSTAIEGNTMTRAQVEDVVEGRKATARLVEALEVEAYARAADWIYREAVEYRGVPLDVVAEIHRKVVELPWRVGPPITRERPGDWRAGGVTVRGVTVSLPAAVPADLDDWARSTVTPQGGRHLIAHAAMHHAWFERIHPFVDGNGRVGRLVLNFMLIQSGYPPAVILATQRQRYLRALAIADAGNSNPLTEVIARAVAGTLSRFLIPKLAGEAKLVPLGALASQSNYSADYLRQLAQNGRLRAIREGRLWLSSRAWLNDYIGRRDRRGGPPGRRTSNGPTRI